jgi:hypothetical protein
MKATTQADCTAEATLTNLVRERQVLKAELDSLAERLKNIDESVITQFNEAGITKFETDLGKVNLIVNNTVVWNEEVLAEILTTAQWNRISVRKLDKARLEAELTIGRIDSDNVDVAKSIKQSKPFIR